MQAVNKGGGKRWSLEQPTRSGLVSQLRSSNRPAQLANVRAFRVKPLKFQRDLSRFEETSELSTRGISRAPREFGRVQTVWKEESSDISQLCWSIGSNIMLCGNRQPPGAKS